MGFQVYRLERNNNVLWGASVVRIMTRKKPKTVQYRTVRLLKNKYFQVKQFKQLIKYQELLLQLFLKKDFATSIRFLLHPLCLFGEPQLLLLNVTARTHIVQKNDNVA